MPESPNSPDASILRILDANQNRAREALRVIEEYLRFTLDDAHLTSLAKSMRHRMQAALARLPRPAILLARDTITDVGTSISTESEMKRSDQQAVLAAAFSRASESLRALEEYSKVVDPTIATAMEQLRYETYTLEKAAGATASSIDRLADCRLYVLLDGMSSEAEFADRTAALIAAGVDAIQLRDKSLDDRELLGRARALTAATRGSETLAIVNDRPDIALVAHADGVHVGQEELPVADVRRLVGTNMLIGLSTHNIEQARAGVLAGADYLGVGPTFASTTKQFNEFAGIDFVREVAAEIRLPAFAIGGIDRSNVGEVVAAGLGRIAVSGALAGASDLTEVVRELKATLAAGEQAKASVGRQPIDEPAGRD